ncbi:MAG TPA: hypothetical protein VLE95_08355 [Chlamydiales bacterium]|nr:hypothetical protein [Chlamydiales bacterium]
MKRILRTASFLMFALFPMASNLNAQETGTAASMSAEMAQDDSNWQNWVFASSALVTATIGVIIISLNSGTTSH